MIDRWIVQSVCVVLLASTIGCVSTSNPAPVKIAAPRDASDAITSTPDQAVASDPCAARMHDISGAILLYYAVNKHLPDKLDELQALADADQQLDFVCPVSHEPYVYVPQGLSTPGQEKRIILHDASPAHRGQRWCIFMAPNGPGAAQSVEVLLVPDPIFRAYLLP